ncbi:MAG: thioredoxin family protein [Proteobacteria bacterium]|nr:thioredoxin family protein [Pseudomonadota bacterium]
MALTYSQMLDLGTKLPEFELLNTVDNNKFSSKSLSKNKGKLVMFICNHCPYVIHYHQQIIDISNQYSSDIELVAISANDVINYPEDSPQKMTELFSKLGLKFPYLYDETQQIAKKYKAECTPEFYLFDKDDLLIYRGRMDSSSPSQGNPTGEDLRAAIDNFLSGKPVSDKQLPSMGCNIKWR